MYRRTTIAAAATALALLGGGSALAANAGLFGGDRPDGAGTLPAVSTLDPGPTGDAPGPAGDSTALPNPSTDTAPPPAGQNEPYESEPDERGEVEDDD